jgi:hypothetical protein
MRKAFLGLGGLAAIACLVSTWSTDAEACRFGRRRCRCETVCCDETSKGEIKPPTRPELKKLPKPLPPLRPLPTK